ncbi:MAG: putative ABC transporter permease [Oscillospiraceae bacterium]|nr:putative ABC transporter permease [Oscillospiraceae bacterium]
MSHASKAASWVLEFTVCAFCGWLYEVLLGLAVYHVWEDRGLLHLPVCPIYGFGAFALLLLYRKRSEWWFVLLTSTFLTTVLELAASYLLEHMGFRPWDYSDWPLHFEWRISVPSSLIFGLLALVLVKAVHPLMRRFAEKAPAPLTLVLGAVCGIAIAVDAAFVFLLR